MTGREKALAALATLGWLAAAVMTWLWSARMRPDWVMGSVAEWAAALFTGGALAGVWVAARQLRAAQADSHARELRDRRAQASKVHLRVAVEMDERAAGVCESAHFHYVMNGSNEPIRATTYFAIEPEGDDVIVNPARRVLAPGEECFGALFDFTDSRFPSGVRAMQPNPSRDIHSEHPWDVAITFADSAGVWWIRLPDLRVEELPGEPTTSEVIRRVRLERRVCQPGVR